MNGIQKYGLGSLSTKQIVKGAAILVVGGLLAWGSYKVFSLKNMWDKLTMKFRAKIVWKTILTDILSGNITLAVTAYLTNTTSAHITIKKPAISIYDGTTLLAHSDETDTEKVSINANSISEVHYTFVVKAQALTKFAGMALTKIIEWWKNLNTENETAAIGVSLNVVATVSLFGFSKNFESQISI